MFLAARQQYVDGRRLESDILLAKGEPKKALEVMKRLRPGLSRLFARQTNWRVHISSNNNLNQAKAALEEAISANPN